MVQGIQYYDYVVCLRFYVDSFVDLVKCGMLTLYILYVAVDFSVLMFT